MPLGSRIQAIKALYAAYIRPIDQKLKTDILQPTEPNGDNPMASLTKINDQTHTHTVTIAVPGITTPYLPQLINMAHYSPQYAYAAQSNATYPPQYHAVTTQQLPPHQLYPAATLNVAPPPQWFTGPLGYYDYLKDECIPSIQPSRSEFTEEEITQAEQLMAELSNA